MVAGLKLGLKEFRAGRPWHVDVKKIWKPALNFKQKTATPFLRQEYANLEGL